MQEDENGTGVCHAGIALIRCRKRHTTRTTLSRMESRYSIWSNFYNCYLDIEGKNGEIGHKGNFGDLDQMTGVRVKPEMTAAVTDLLEWNAAVLSFFQSSGCGTTLERKKECFVIFSKRHVIL